MGKFDGLLICSDYDGTLAYKGSVSEENFEAIRYFREHGGSFTLATGRYPSSIIRRMGADFLRPTPVICMNGGILYDVAREQVLFAEELPDGYRKTVLEATRWQGIRDIRLFPNRDLPLIQFLPEERDALKEAWDQPLIKVVLHVDTEVSDEVRNRLRELLSDDFTVERSWLNGLEIYGSSYGKGVAARSLCRMLGKETLIAVGDYENDLSMIREADIGVAIGDAIPAVKEAADQVTATAKDHGVARLIYSL